MSIELLPKKVLPRVSEFPRMSVLAFLVSVSLGIAVGCCLSEREVPIDPLALFQLKGNN